VKFREPPVWNLYMRYILVASRCSCCCGVDRELAAQTRKLQLSDSQLRDLSGRLIHAQDEERKRIARELHDDFGQRISLLKIELEFMAREERPLVQTGGDSRLRDVISKRTSSRPIFSTCLTRSTSRLQFIGLQSALTELCSDVGHRQGVAVELRAEPLPSRAPEVLVSVPRRAGRPAQATKHSGASEIIVTTSDGKRGVRMQITTTGKAST